MNYTKSSLAAVLIALIFACLVGCAAATGESGAPDERPADFALRYDWRIGSVAPASRYEYEIEIESDGAARVTMFSDYKAAGVPEFAEDVTLTAEHLDRLYRTLVENKLLTNKWQKSLDPAPPGAPTQRLLVTAGKRQIELDGNLTDKAQADRIFQSINDAVPTAVWQRLRARLDKYKQSSK